MERGASKVMAAFAIGAGACMAVGGFAWIAARRPAVFELHAYGTPGGMSMLIRTPDDVRILIDGGSNGDIVRRITRSLPFYSRRIDMIVSTGFDGKLTTGLIDALDRYDVGTAVLPAVSPASVGISTTSDRIYGEFLRTLADRKTAIERMKAGDTMRVGSSVVMAALFPADGEKFAYSNASPPELLLRFEHGATSIVIAGKATTKIERYVAASSTRADALIIDANPTEANIAREFMTAIDPRIVIYSAQAKGAGAASRAGQRPKKKAADPMAGVRMDMRANVRERGEATLVSDGASIELR